MPKIGPFKKLGFNNPTPQTADLYIKSINATVDQYRAYLEAVRTGTLVLPNYDFDTGNPTRASEYSLTDDSYAKLLGQLSDRKFDLASADLRANILQFYSDLTLPIETKKDAAHWQGVLTGLDQLKDAAPVSDSRGPPGAGDRMNCCAAKQTLIPHPSHPTAPNSLVPIRRSICVSIIEVAAVLALVLTGHAQSVASRPAPAMPPVIVIGFVGGFIRHDNPNHSEVQLAARLRQAYPSGVKVETFESYHKRKARKRVLSLLDTNHDGTRPSTRNRKPASSFTDTAGAAPRPWPWPGASKKMASLCS